MRAREQWAAVIWLLLAAIIIGSSLGLAAKANADIDAVESAYIAQYGPTAVCPVIAMYPTEGGVMGVMEGIHQDGFSYVDSVEIINASVATYCPQWWDLLEYIGAKARNEIAGVKVA